ncbi:MAG: Cache 3/Cache 2 fusion domain-containing protein [Bacteroidaceae bacterium]|nr:Cache 3/Cache 2 fusion domain-containing protein [Bacteroidaceae bacterium]
MKNPLTKIRHSLSLRLSLWILFFAVVVFVASLGFMYIRSRNYVRDDALQRATKVLDNTTLRMTEILTEVEIATTNTEWLVRTHQDPDSVVKYSRRIVELNPRFNGCSIAFEPNFFPDKGLYYSIYSGHESDTIQTEQEGSKEYNYFDMDWYTIPKRTKQSSWIDPFFDFYLDDIYVQEMITSYSKPILNDDGQFIGVVSTDLSLKWLSRTMNETRPSERSYCFMLGKEGNYFIHPDSTKLVYKTIFSDTDPDKDVDQIKLGNAMVSGQSGMMSLMHDGEYCYVFYRHLPQTGWSIAIVYPESEIFKGYNRLFYIVMGIIIVGLLLLLILCRQIVKSALVPVNQLARQARHIAAGNFDDHMEPSDRIDAVGLLQNSFCKMQKFISGYISDIRMMNEETKKRNVELTIANEQAQVALEKKTAFMQDVTHQVRTPLNIIIGFSQVIRDDHQSIPEEEMELILDTMQENSENIQEIIEKMLTAGYLENRTSITKDTPFACNDLCREIMSKIKLKCPETVKLNFETSVPDSLTIFAHKQAFPKMLKQMLDNANQFTKQGSITLSCRQDDDNTVTFTVTDTGIGIAEADEERIFIPFFKLDYYSEGLGIGLNLVRRSAEVQGGTFYYDNTYHDGARFILTMPLKD